MEKYKTRRARRKNNLSTVEAIQKVLIAVYWAKKEGKPYSISSLCDIEHVGHLNKAVVEKTCSWDVMPTKDDAERVRKANLDYIYEKIERAEQAQNIVEQPELEFDMDEATHCNDFGILTWNGHRYRLVPID